MELPDLSKASNLREVSISGCKSLRQVPPSAVCSQKLKYLKVSNCESLERKNFLSAPTPHNTHFALFVHTRD
ncbi:hypothetical protein HN873_061736 [Arachis hypogaea]